MGALLPAIGWPGGSPENTGIIVAVIVGAYLAAVWLAAVVWTARDIRDRSRDPISQLVAVLIVLIFNLPGWVLYRVLRPTHTLAEEYDRRLEEEALLMDLRHSLVCPRCDTAVDDDYVACPRCATRLKDTCRACSKALNPEWRTCPWCAAPVRARSPQVDAPEPASAAFTEPEFEEETPAIVTSSGGGEERPSPFRRPGRRIAAGSE